MMKFMYAMYVSYANSSQRLQPQRMALRDDGRAWVRVPRIEASKLSTGSSKRFPCVVLRVGLFGRTHTDGRAVLCGGGGGDMDTAREG